MLYLSSNSLMSDHFGEPHCKEVTHFVITTTLSDKYFVFIPQVIQELAEEDEEDSKPLPPIDGPGVKVLALEGPLFEEHNEDSIVAPLPALEGPPTDEDGQVEGKEVILAGSTPLYPMVILCHVVWQLRCEELSV